MAGVSVVGVAVVGVRVVGVKVLGADVGTGSAVPTRETIVYIVTHV